MKLSLIVPIALLALAGCASSAPPPPRQIIDVTPPAEPAKPKALEVDNAKFSIKLPAGWVVRPGGPKTEGQVTQQLVARSPDFLGKAPVLVAINTVALDPDDPIDGDFGGAVAVGAMKSGALVLMAQPSKVDGLEGSIVMMVLPTDTPIVVLQQAVGHKRTGYVVRCGGDAQQGDKIIELCQPIFESFHIKK